MNYHSLGRPVRHLSVGSRRRPWLLIAAAVLLLVAAAVLTILLWPGARQAIERQTGSGATPPASKPTVDLKLPPPDAIRPLTPEEAILANEQRPFTAAPGTPAPPFSLRADAISQMRAIDCLTQAVYYEAASEGADGGRAVAQVVLNRMRHPAYPNSVCGVVYQGSTRTTGCQFTFTCDGSLLRAPSAYLWARSRTIAQEALAGRVHQPVGLATHYHADYVLPYWADSLDKLVQIGRHIFYKIKGGLGSKRAFSQRYAGAEPQPTSTASSAAVLEEALEVTESTSEPLAPATETEETGPKPINDESPVAPALPPATPLAIDGAGGSLIVDGDGAPSGTPARTKPRAAEEGCSSGNRGSTVEAIRANDLRAGQAGQRC